MMQRPVKIVGQAERGISAVQHAALALVLAVIIIGSLVQVAHVLANFTANKTPVSIIE